MSNDTLAFYNGSFRPVSQCSIPITDMAVQRGVGVFDSIRTFKCRAFALQDHMERLALSAKTAGIDADAVIAPMRDAIREGIKRADCPGHGDCVVKAYITGGDVNETWRFPSPRWFVIFTEAVMPTREQYAAGVALEPTDARRPYPVVKSMNYLPGFMSVAGMDDVAECLYCPDGKVTETLTASFFICSGGRLITAPVGEVLAGVTRGIVVGLARDAGYKVDERCPDVSELEGADEAFLTSSLREVLPVVRVGGKAIGRGKPGPVSSHLLQLYRANIEAHLDQG